MRIHMYGILWNEAPLLPYFFRHYDPHVERYALFDDGSDDGTLDILARHPRVDVRRFDRRGSSVCRAGSALKSQVWKESRGAADLVLVCDVDELLWHADLAGFLDASLAAGATVFQPEGWEMMSPSFPATAGQIYDEVRRGYRAIECDKPCLFDPSRIEEIRYGVGCHVAAPTGEVVWRRGRLRLLHFKHLGVPYVTQRYAALRSRLGPRDLREGWGRQYAMSEAEIRRAFETAPLVDLFAEPCRDLPESAAVPTGLARLAPVDS